MASFCRLLFHFLLVKPLALVVLGLNVRGRQGLPAHGPAIIIANHNSHLDTVVLLSLFPFSLAKRIRPVAAADSFLRNSLLGWFALSVLRIIPVDRTNRGGAVAMLAAVDAALSNGEIILLFPEGTRGEAERLGEFRSGVAHVVKRNAGAPIIPIFIHGAGKSLPRGEALLVPFFCDIFVGERVQWNGDRDQFMLALQQQFQDITNKGEFPPWL